MHKLVLPLSLLYGSFAMAQAVPISARIYDGASVSEKVLQRAEVKVTQLFQACKLPIEWLDCKRQRDVCRGELRPNDIVFLLEPYAPGKVYAAGGAVIERPHSGVYAHIYFPRILDIARDSSIPESILLAQVMAHELGHLLGLAHVPNGIMAKRWEQPALRYIATSWQRFYQDECRQMRAETRIRLSLTTSY